MARKPGFEQQMERLSAIVAELEKGGIPLDKSVALYKEGQSLINACRGQLEKARHAVTLREASGTVPFEETADSGEEA